MTIKKPSQPTMFLIVVSLAIMFGTKALPTNSNKNAGGLRLNTPVECPDSVQFTWTGGAADTTYSIYRRMHGDTNWERIAMNLTGVSGTTFVPGFTLDRDYDYEIRADQP